MIYVYNLHKEDHCSDENDFYIGRGSILGNPYTHIKNKITLASFIVNTRDEAINNYSHYFDLMYKSNIMFRDEIDKIYELYKNGKDVYLGCFCKKYLTTDNEPHSDDLSCHGDIIKSKLEQRLIKEKIKQIKLLKH
jgi:hypothetical protein